MAAELLRIVAPVRESVTLTGRSRTAADIAGLSSTATPVPGGEAGEAGEAETADEGKRSSDPTQQRGPRHDQGRGPTPGHGS